MGILENANTHYDPVLVRTQAVIIAAVIVTLVAVALSCLVLQEFVPSILISSAIIFGCLSAFLAGNAYRLSDIRSRSGMQAKMNGTDRLTVLAQLPPIRVVRFRYRIAKYGFGVAVAMLLLSFLTVRVELEEYKPLAGVAVLGLVAAAAVFLCGLWSRPID